MSHLCPTELHTHPDSVAFSQKLLDLACLYFYIMLVCTRTQPNLFQRNRLLILACFVFFLGLLILITPIVHQLADGRYSIRRYLDKVKTSLTGNIKRTSR